MKIPTARVISEPAASSPSRKRMSMASIWRTKLSLKAEKNWHQNRGAKCRADISLLNMTAVPAPSGRPCCDVSEYSLTNMQGLSSPGLAYRTPANEGSAGPARESAQVKRAAAREATHMMMKTVS